MADNWTPINKADNWTPLRDVNVGPAPKRNALAAGLSSGLDDLAGLGYSAVGAVADSVGATGTRDWANEQADRNQYLSGINGRPDLERIEDQTPGTFLPYLGYQVAKQAPNIVGAVGAGLMVPEVAVPAALARGLAVGPRALGMGGMAGRVAAATAEGGSTFAARRAALEAGQTFGKQIVGGGAFNYGQSVGSLYQESVDGGDPDSGVKSLLGGVPYALAETLPEAMLVGRIGHGSGFKGNIASRIGKAAASQGATGTTSELLQNEMEMAYNGSVTDDQAFSKRLNSGVAGGLVEGLLGGLGGVRKHGPTRATLEQQGTADLLNQKRGLQLGYTPAEQQGYTVFPDGSVATNADAELMHRYDMTGDTLGGLRQGGVRTDPTMGTGDTAPYLPKVMVADQAGQVATDAVGANALHGETEGDPGLAEARRRYMEQYGGGSAATANDPALTPQVATQTPQVVQQVLEANQAAQQQREAEAAPPPLTPEQQEAQARVAQIKQAAVEAAQQVQERNKRAADFGITKPAVLTVYGELERAHTDGLVDDKEFGNMAGQLSAGETNAVRKELVDRRKLAEAKVEQDKAVKLSDEEQVRDVFAKVQKPTKTAPPVPAAPVVTIENGVKKTVAPYVEPERQAALAPAGTAARIVETGAPASGNQVAGIDANKRIVIGRSDRQKVVTPALMLARIQAASGIDKLRIMAATGLDVTNDPTTGASRLVHVGNPMTFAEIAKEESAKSGKEVSRADITQALKKFEINQDVATQVASSFAPQAVTADELGISPENNGSGFRVEGELSKATGQGLVDDGNAPTKAQRELSAKADDLLKTAGPSTAVAEAPTSKPGTVVTDVRDQNTALVQQNIEAALAHPEAKNAEADWGSELVPWDKLPDTLKADWINAYLERLNASEGELTQKDFRLLDAEQVNIENDYADITKNAGREAAPTQPGVSTDVQQVAGLDGQEAQPRLAAETERADPSTGTGTYNGDTGERTGDAPKPVVVVKKKRTVEKPAAPAPLNNLERIGANSAPVINPSRSPSVVRRLRTLLSQLNSDRLSPNGFITMVEVALRGADDVRDSKPVNPRERGADYIRQRLLEAKRRGDLSEQGVDMAEWFILRNPQLVNDLGVAIRKNTDQGISGSYDPVTRVMRLIKESGNDETVVHEILHHLERMLPAKIQQALRTAWGRQLATALVDARKGTDANLAAYYKALTDFHFGGDTKALKVAEQLLKDGKVDYAHYALFNPSEFWAVHGSRIVQGRFNVSQSTLGQLRQWLGELGQKIKSLLGLKSDAAVIRALDSMAKSDGSFVSGQMLGQGKYYMYAGAKAQDAVRQADFQVAQSMLEAGESAEKVRRSTGWFQNPYDKKWRFEIADNNAEFSTSFERLTESKVFSAHTEYRLGDVLTHGELFQRYPEAADIKLFKRPGFMDFGSLQGSFDGKNTIVVTPYAKNPLSTLLHEVQHWVQSQEGFASGGNQSMVFDAMNDEQRKRLASEVVGDLQEKLSANAEAQDAAKKMQAWPRLNEYLDARSEYNRASKAHEDSNHPERRAGYEALRVMEKARDTEVFGTSNPLSLPRAVYQFRSDTSFGPITREELQNVGDKLQQKGVTLQKNLAGVQSGDLESLKKSLNGSDRAHKLYQSIAGEIEARDTQARQAMTPSDRADTAPLSSESFDPKDVIVVSGAEGEQQSFNNIERTMPTSARQAQTVVGNVFKQAVTQGKLWMAMTDDLARMASKIIRSVDESYSAVTKYMDLMRSAQVAKTAAERKVEQVLDMYAAIPKHEQGMGPMSANKFLQDSTTDKKWGYKPAYHADAVVDPEMEQRFKRLSPASQQLIQAVFQHGHDNLQAMKAAVMDNIHTDFDALIAEADRVGDTAQATKERAAKVKALTDFTSLNNLKGNWPYAPLKRFGNHVVVGMSKEYLAAEKAGNTKLTNELKLKAEHYHVAFAETHGARNSLAEQLQAQARQFSKADGGLTQAFSKDDASEQLYSGKDALGMFRRMRTLVANSEDEHLSGKSAAALRGLMADLHLMLLSESSARQSERQRLNIAGADGDMMRAFATQGRATAHFIANMQNSGKVYDALSEMKDQTDARVDEPGNTRTERREYYNELMKRHAMGLDYDPSPFVNKALGFSSLWHLMVSPAYYLTNMTQPFVMSLPVMAGKHGYGKSAAALTRAYRELMPLLKKGKLSEADYAKLPADIRVAVGLLVDQGHINISQEQDLGRWRSEDNSKFKYLGNVIDKMREVSQSVEAINRLTTAMASLRLEAAAGVSLDRQVANTGRLIDETHGNYSGFNAPRIMRTPVGRLLTQFRKFQLIQVSLFTRMIHDSFKGASPEERTVARAALGYSLGHMFALGGLLGMPGAQVIGFILRHSIGDGDEPDNPELTLRKLIGDETVADLLVKGLPKMLGVDVSGRVGAGGMLSLAPYADLDMSKKGAESLIVQAAGPFVGGMLPKFAQGLGMISQGQLWKGLEQLMPTGMDNVSKTLRMQSQGMTMSNGDQVMKPEDISFLDATMQVLGLPTNTLTDRQFQSNTAFESDKFFKEKANQIKSDYVAAHRAGDGEAASEARQAWAELQDARKRNGYDKQGLGELMKAPQAQVKREKNVIGGVEYRKGNKGARQMVDEVS